MKRTELKFLHSKPEAYNNVTVAGWVRTIRDSKSFGFIELNDGSCFKNTQIVIEESVISNYKEIVSLNVGAAITVEGKVVLTPEMKQPFEIKAEKVCIEGESSPDYPLQKKRHSPEFLRTIAHLRPRANTYNAVFRVRSVAAFALHKFFQENGFCYVHTPIITGSDCEGAGEMFHVTSMPLEEIPKTESGEVDYNQDFFNKSANLTVSGQLNAECFALAFGKVYTFGPTFRAEKSNTPRHAAEFWMIEPEIAFADINDCMDVAESMIKYVIKYIMEQCPDELEFFNKFVDNGLLDRLNNLVNSEFKQMTYTEAVNELEKVKDKFSFPVYWGCDLQTEHEKYLTEEIVKGPVFVTDYPKEIKAFYMRLNDDGKTVAAVDMLVPGVGEIIGGSQREERPEMLAKAIETYGLNKEDYWWYEELRKFGGTKHAGYGLGFERLIMYVTGISNIRDVIPFPRTTGSAEF